MDARTDFARIKAFEGASDPCLAAEVTRALNEIDRGRDSSVEEDVEFLKRKLIAVIEQVIKLSDVVQNQNVQIQGLVEVIRLLAVTHK